MPLSPMVPASTPELDPEPASTRPPLLEPPLLLDPEPASTRPPLLEPPLLLVDPPLLDTPLLEPPPLDLPPSPVTSDEPLRSSSSTVRPPQPAMATIATHAAVLPACFIARAPFLFPAKEFAPRI
jgi:hypothetical protein